MSTDLKQTNVAATLAEPPPAGQLETNVVHDSISDRRPVGELPQYPPDDPDDDPDMYFRVELDIFRGPLDLLLYLVRKHELDVCEVAIARITEQFIAHMEILEQLDVNLVGDFFRNGRHAD